MVTASNKYNIVGTWLHGLMENLVFEDDTPVFKKVIVGVDEKQLQNFGDGALGVCYVTGTTDYTETLGIHNRPKYINSVVAFTIKGSNTKRYDLATRIMDLIHHNFETNSDWLKLVDTENHKNIIRDTDITGSELTITPNGKKLDIIGVFTLRHHVYK